MLIPPTGPVHASQFAEWLILADNLNPNLPDYASHKAALIEAFVAHMGAETVDASFLCWSNCEPHADQPELKYRGKIDNLDD